VVERVLVLGAQFGGLGQVLQRLGDAVPRQRDASQAQVPAAFLRRPGDRLLEPLLGLVQVLSLQVVLAAPVVHPRLGLQLLLEALHDVLLPVLFEVEQRDDEGVPEGLVLNGKLIPRLTLQEAEIGRAHV
jgi:hypothetical protein